MEIIHLPIEEIRLIAEIDRSEHIDVGYTVEDGELVAREVDWRVPPWDPIGSGEHSVQARIEAWRPVLERGGSLLGAFDDGGLAGLAIVEPGFEPGMAWLALLHVSRPHRRKGAAASLWEEAERIARDSGAATMYVSGTPSRSAVGFYLSRGCILATPPHPELHAMEPDDIHFIRPL